MYKIFKHTCIRCLGRHILVCNNKIFFLCFFPFIPFATQPLSTPVTSSNLCNQAPLFTALCLLQGTLIACFSSLVLTFFKHFVCLGFFIIFCFFFKVNSGVFLHNIMAALCMEQDRKVALVNQRQSSK